MPGYEKIGNRVIEFDQTYSLCFTGGTRELPKKDQDVYNGLLKLPFELQTKEKLRMKLWETPEKDPNVLPVKGVDLVGYIKELHVIPIFDNYFATTHRLYLTDRTSYEYIKANTQSKLKRG